MRSPEIQTVGVTFYLFCPVLRNEVFSSLKAWVVPYGSQNLCLAKSGTGSRSNVQADDSDSKTLREHFIYRSLSLSSLNFLHLLLSFEQILHLEGIWGFPKAVEASREIYGRYDKV